MDTFSLTLLLILCVIFTLYFIYQKNYWAIRNVPFVNPLPIFGNLKPLIMLEKSPGPFLGELYNAIPGIGQPFLGIFLFNCEPALLIKDPTLIKGILIQNFDHFRNRNVECNPSCDPIGAKNLFVIRDAKWKYLRTKLSPTFTSGKLKQMFLFIKETMFELTNIIDENIESQQEPPCVEFKELIAKYTTDVINICAFGIKSNALGDPNSQFRYFGKKIFNKGAKRSLETRAFFFMHWLANIFRFVFFEKESSKFMADIFGQLMKERDKNVTPRNDFMDVLIKLKNDLKHLNRDELKELSGLDDESVLAQAPLLFTAGFETTSLTIAFTLYELALEPEIQSRLRREVLKSLAENSGNLNYDALMQMKYLDMVVSETLRKYPPMPFLDRICTKDFPIPNSSTVIKKGTPVFIALYKGLHYDPEYFPEPEKYNPDRFSDPGRIIPYSYLPFGEGPHICLGMRFGILNTKTAISLILSKYKVEICEGTTFPMEISPRSFTLCPKGDLFLRFIPL